MPSILPSTVQSLIICSPLSKLESHNSNQLLEHSREKTSTLCNYLHPSGTWSLRNNNNSNNRMPQFYCRLRAKVYMHACQGLYTLCVVLRSLGDFTLTRLKNHLNKTFKCLTKNKSRRVTKVNNPL